MSYTNYINTIIILNYRRRGLVEWKKEQIKNTTNGWAIVADGKS